LPGSLFSGAFEIDTPYSDSLMRAHLGISSNIETSTAVFGFSIRRVADIGECRGGYWGIIIDASMLTVAKYVLALLRMPGSVRQTRGPSGAFEDADFCT
jgi:hypothetical protein